RPAAGCPGCPGTARGLLPAAGLPTADGRGHAWDGTGHCTEISWRNRPTRNTYVPAGQEATFSVPSGPDSTPEWMRPPAMLYTSTGAVPWMPAMCSTSVAGRGHKATVGPPTTTTPTEPDGAA